MGLWSVARYDLGQTTEEFYSLTPAQFYALTLRDKEAKERAELLMGIICSTTANHSFNTPTKAKCPLDYMPSQWAVRAAARENKPKRFSRKRFAAQLSAMGKMIGKTIEVERPESPKVENN
jgi:hypothetical protein